MSSVAIGQEARLHVPADSVFVGERFELRVAIEHSVGSTVIFPKAPEGDPENVRYPGTLSLRQETFRMVLEDVANSLRSQGFTDVVLIGDSGGNQRGLRETAIALNERWTDARAHYIPEYYSKPAVVERMERELGIVQPIDEGLHDNYVITSEIMITDPTAVRYEQRVKAGKASINGLSIVPKEKTNEIGRKATNAKLTRRTDQFHFAFVIHVTTVSSIAPMAMLVKNSQFETYDCQARSASVTKAKTKPTKPTTNIPRNTLSAFLERGRY